MKKITKLEAAKMFCCGAKGYQGNLKEVAQYGDGTLTASDDITAYISSKAKQKQKPKSLDPTYNDYPNMAALVPTSDSQIMQLVVHNLKSFGETVKDLKRGMGKYPSMGGMEVDFVKLGDNYYLNYYSDTKVVSVKLEQDIIDSAGSPDEYAITFDIRPFYKIVDCATKRGNDLIVLKFCGSLKPIMIEFGDEEQCILMPIQRRRHKAISGSHTEAEVLETNKKIVKVFGDVKIYK